MRVLFLSILEPQAAEQPLRLSGQVFDAGKRGLRARGEASSDVQALARAAVGCTVLLQLPVRAVAWHRLDMPRGLRGPKLQSALRAMLEERLLQPIEDVHVAIAPGFKPGQPAWVLACDAAWLVRQVAAVQAAGLAVHRIVPSLLPPEQGLRWLIDAPAGLVVRADAADGVAAFEAEMAEAMPAHWQMPALASLAALTEQDLAAVLASGWNIAQFDQVRLVQAGGTAGRWGGLRRLLSEPLWRPMRRAAAGVALAWVAGLVVWAWRADVAMNEQRSDWARMLRQSFPNVKLVVDAPVQFARELQMQREHSGMASPDDLDSLLAATGQAWPEAAEAARSLRYADGELVVSGAALGPDDKRRLGDALRARGYAMSDDHKAQALRIRRINPSR